MDAVKTYDQSFNAFKERFKNGGLRSNAILLVILLGLFVFASFASESFLKTQNLLNLLRIVSLTGIMAIGVTFVILVGEIDLSVGAILSMSAVMGGKFLDWGIGPVLLLTCGMGLLAGLVNGIGVIKGKVPSLIMTLGTMVAFSGLANIISGGKAVYPYKLPAYLWLGKGNLLGVPFPIIVFAAVALISIFVLGYTRTGRWIFYSGANRTASRFSGGRTDRVIILTFLISGLCA
ncbi:MAG: ABC transporter permease, partial [Chlorobiales bacterium]|nr:ABC transporter permease [Chlorobiales bacterium]